VLDRGEHVIAEALVERRLERVHLLGQPREPAAVQPRDHVQVRQHAVVAVRLEDAHARVHLVEVHRGVA